MYKYQLILLSTTYVHVLIEKASFNVVPPLTFELN